MKKVASVGILVADVIVEPVMAYPEKRSSKNWVVCISLWFGTSPF